MLTKYLPCLVLVVTASAALLSSIDEPSSNHQKEFKMDVPMSYGDPHASGSSYRRFDLAKRDGKFFSLPLIYRDSKYYIELYMGSRGERIEATINIQNPDTTIIESKAFCNAKTKREIQLKREIPEHNQKGPQSFVTEKHSGAAKIKESKEKIPSYLDISKRDESKCKTWGTFNKDRSKTFKLYEANPSFSINYFGGSSAHGIWGSDKVGTSKTMVRMVFAVTNSLNGPRSFLGLGTIDGTTMENQKGKQYANFPMALKNAGYIKKMTYSLYLPRFPWTGSILFGAVDHQKYVGKLQTVPMVNGYVESIKRIDLIVVLSKIYLENSNSKVVLLNEPIAAELSLGKFLGFPKNTYLALVESLSGVYCPEYDKYKVSCTYYTSMWGSMVYDFSGIQIKVLLRDLIDIKQGKCYLNANVSPSYKDQLPIAFLGNSFLKNVYLNVDLESKEVSMAQVKGTEEEEIEEISTSVSRAVKAEGYSSTSLVSSVSKPTVAQFKN